MNEDRATRYHRFKRQLGILGWVLDAAAPRGLAWTGWSGRAPRRRRVSGGEDRSGDVAAPHADSADLRWSFSPLLNEIGSLPLGWYTGYVVERRYGLSNETLAHWVRGRSEVARHRLVAAAAAARR